MNIFVLDNNPKLAARYHCDKHVIKMCLEYAQLLSTAVHECDGVVTDGLYRPTHRNHPCAIWVRESIGNVMWLRELLKHLGMEYRQRYGKEHRSVAVGLLAARRLTRCLPIRPRTPFVLAMPDQYRSGDAVAAYRAYYIADKAAFARWKTGAPKWWPR